MNRSAFSDVGIATRAVPIMAQAIVVAMAATMLALIGCTGARPTAPPQNPAWVLTVSTVAQVQSFTSSGLPGDTTIVEIPAGQSLSLAWYAGRILEGKRIEYRWALDPRRLSLEYRRPRFGDHWSTWGPDLAARIGPFGGSEVHVLIVEARNETDARSRLTVLIHVVENHLDPAATRGRVILPPSSG